MKTETLPAFTTTWIARFEYDVPLGHTPIPECLVVEKGRSKRKLRLSVEELRALAEPPYPTDETSLIVGWKTSELLSCHLVLGWPLPVNVLDLHTEFRNVTNGLNPPCGTGLAGALIWFGRSFKAELLVYQGMKKELYFFFLWRLWRVRFKAFLWLCFLIFFFRFFTTLAIILAPRGFQ